MSKFNTTSVRSKLGEGFIKSSKEESTTFEGGNAYNRSEKSELFLAAVSDFGGEATFYESAENRSNRIISLAKRVAVSDLEWYSNLVKWLRSDANLRSISLILALEGAKALLDAGVPGGRKLVANSMLRADEPGEAIAYWYSVYGRSMPSAVKRGIADAVVRLYTEFSLGKYDTASKGFRFGDVIRIVHPTPKDAQQAELFKFAIARRMDSSVAAPESLRMADRRKALLALDPEDLRKLVQSAEGSEKLQEAGLTWENVAGQIGLDAKTWEALIPTMGYMALLRNLRNFEQAGVSDEALDWVARKISDPEQVARSRQMPFRFLSAFLATSGETQDRYSYYYDGGARRFSSSESLRFSYPLEKALKASLKNVPYLKGKTLILVDRSGSMFGSPSKNTQLNFADSAAIFGSALAVRAEDATLVQFGTDAEEVPFTKNGSVLSLMKKFKGMGGTNLGRALSGFYDSSYDRVIIVTDEQYSRGAGNYVDAKTPIYTWNLVGYGTGMDTKTGRYTFGGLTDQSFKMISFIEAGRDAVWPWEETS